MSFQDAVRTCLQQKYADFSGRARRSEFWFFVLFNIIVSIVASILDSILHTKMGSTGTGIIGTLAGLALLVPGIAVAIRRLHDTNRSGWWFLIVLVPFVGGIVLLVFNAMEGTPGDNSYGASPKALGGAYGA
jgi:uncharacterized membrane protein YhaH (DUF805 family)